MDADLAELDAWLGTLEDLQKSLHSSNQIPVNRSNTGIHSVSASPNSSTVRSTVNTPIAKHVPITPPSHDSTRLLPPLPKKNFKISSESPLLKRFPTYSEQLSPNLQRKVDDKEVDPGNTDVITSSSRTSLFCASNSGTIARSPHSSSGTVDGSTQKREIISITTTREVEQINNGQRNRENEEESSLIHLDTLLNELHFSHSPETKLLLPPAKSDFESSGSQVKSNGDSHIDFMLPSPGSDETFSHELPSPFQSNLPPPSHALLFDSTTSSPNENFPRTPKVLPSNYSVEPALQNDPCVVGLPPAPLQQKELIEHKIDANRVVKAPPPLPVHRNSSSGTVAVNPTLPPNSCVNYDHQDLYSPNSPKNTPNTEAIVSPPNRSISTSYGARSKSVDLYKQRNGSDTDFPHSINDTLQHPEDNTYRQTSVQISNEKTIERTPSCKTTQRHHSLGGENSLTCDSSKKHVLVRIFQHDKSSKALAVDESTTCRDICNLLIRKNNWSPSVSLSLVEKVPSLKMEHCFEDHEKLSDCVFLWKKDCENMIFFEERPDKYGFFHRPQMWLGEKFDTGLSAYGNIKESLFDEKETAPFEWKDYLYMKKPNEKTWNRRYCLIRNGSLYAAKKKKKTLLPNDVTRIIALNSDIRFYTTTGGWTKWKAPTPYGFSLKNMSGENQSFKDVYLFCATDECALRHWVVHLRLSKYGKHLLENYEKAQDDMTDLLQELESHHPNTIQLPPQSHSSNQWYYNHLRDEPPYILATPHRSTDSSSSGPSSPSSPASSHSPWVATSPHPQHHHSHKSHRKCSDLTLNPSAFVSSTN